MVGSLVDVITTVMTTIGIPGLFGLMIVESFGIPPIPSEVILPFAGFLVAEGTYSFAGALVAALAGALVGSYAAYAVGRWWRHRIVGMGVGRLRLRPHDLERVDRFFTRRGPATVALFRMVPVLRSYISYPAGTARMDPVRFGAYTVAGAIPFTVALIYAGTVLRSNWTLVSSLFQPLDYVLAALVVALVLFLLLQVAGVLAPRWPPRRAHPPAPSEASEEAPPKVPPASP